MGERAASTGPERVSSSPEAASRRALEVPQDHEAEVRIHKLLAFSIFKQAERLEAANSLLQKHGNFEWLSGSGEFVVLNNGIEFAATYFIMLLALFFIGAGKYFSVDYWIAQRYRD